MKLAVIGGGSSYSPELVDGLFARLDAIPVTELWMMDHDAERLNITAGFARRMAEHHGSPFSVHHTTDMREAVRDARYVITQIRVGQMDARIADEQLGLRYNIVGQETTGVGGFACALRTIPRILEVAHAMEELAPNGALVNFTNPSGIVTEALVKHSSITSVGLCNVPIGMIMDISERLECKPEDVELDYVGLNHLSWVRGLKIAGQDATQRLLDQAIEFAREEWEVEAICDNMITAIKSLNMWPNGYLQYYYATAAMLEHLKGKEKTRGQEVTEVEQALFGKYADTGLSQKPEELSKRGGAHYSTAAFHLVASIENNTGDRQIVSCRNGGAIPTFDDDAVVEVPAIIDSKGATAVPQDAPAPIIRGLMQCVKAYESLAVEAAVHGDREAAFQAMLMHPLMPGANDSKALLDELLEINKPHLQGTFF